MDGSHCWSHICLSIELTIIPNGNVITNWNIFIHLLTKIQMLFVAAAARRGQSQSWQLWCFRSATCHRGNSIPIAPKYKCKWKYANIGSGGNTQIHIYTNEQILRLIFRTQLQDFSSRQQFLNLDAIDPLSEWNIVLSSLYYHCQLPSVINASTQLLEVKSCKLSSHWLMIQDPTLWVTNQIFWN